MLVVETVFEKWGAFDFLENNNDLAFNSQAGSQPLQSRGVGTFSGTFLTFWKDCLLKISYLDEDFFPKIWSESYVLTDLEIALRLQCRGKSGRLISYESPSNGESILVGIP
jgi:hypothetical protein